MIRLATVALIALWLAPVSAAARADIDVQTSVSQTALWVGSTVAYTVQLTCRAGVDILQEDLGGDRLPVSGLQVVSQAVDRNVLSDGRIAYTMVYRLTTFETGNEAVGVGDWTVRYVAGPQSAGASAPAQELRIPGVDLAWRSALPAALNTLDVRDSRRADAVPAWWRSTRSVGLALLVVSAVAFGWLAITRVAAGRAPKVKRRPGKESARDLQGALGVLRATTIAAPADRLQAYATLEAAVRRHAGEIAALPGAALTPSEFAARLARHPAPISPDDVARILDTCERIRYQPLDRLPSEQEFLATLDAAEQLVGSR